MTAEKPPTLTKKEIDHMACQWALDHDITYHEALVKLVACLMEAGILKKKGR